MGSTLIQHVFVLMLENRSFDHMLGFSGLTGTDASTGAATKINGLTGAESNTFNSQPFAVSRGAPDRMPADPGHEFANVLLQLCGPGASYTPGGAYPAINNSGYVASYVGSGGGSSPGVIMNCYSAAQLPVLHALGGRIRGLRQLACFPARPNLAQSHVSPCGVFERTRSQPQHCGNRRVGNNRRLLLCERHHF